MDLKYDIMKHPAIDNTADGKKLLRIYTERLRMPEQLSSLYMIWSSYLMPQRMCRS